METIISYFKRWIYLVCTTDEQIEQLTKAVNDMSTAVTELTMKLEREE